ncbi:MAG: hypothetical protein A2Z70_02025 [Chloroflexi bacterium RBG_13_48_17]|nr:MAG: hypothetical protein A2Z70_02025 [Chloroflexi bacterium RBG_13_48_17]
MDEKRKSLKVMQRMERLATNVYKQQVCAFKGNEISDKLQKAYENEKEHAETLKEIIFRQNSAPSLLGIFFGFAGAVAGIITLCLGKILLLKIDIFIECKAVEDYTKFISQIDYDAETLSLLNRIIDDEKRHVSTWNASIKALKK